MKISINKIASFRHLGDVEKKKWYQHATRSSTLYYPTDLAVLVLLSKEEIVDIFIWDNITEIIPVIPYTGEINISV